MTKTSELVDVFFKYTCHAQEHNGYLYMLCPTCGKGHIVLKKCGSPLFAECSKTRHYETEREVITSLTDVHKTTSLK